MAGSDEEAPRDAVAELGLLLIREETGEDYPPFCVEGHPNMKENGARLVRAFFHYAVTVTPKTTALFGTGGREGMCRMQPEEILAVWRTPELLAALGTDFEALRGGGAVLAHAPLPEPLWDNLTSSSPC